MHVATSSARASIGARAVTGAGKTRMRMKTMTSTATVARRVGVDARRARVTPRAMEPMEEKEEREAYESVGGVNPNLDRENPELAERFAVIGHGDFQCQSCMYEYKPKVGDDFYPVAAGTQFKDLPNDWRCPTCGAEKAKFKSLGKRVAGFEQNQGYGLGTNSMTEGEKSRLIYGALLFFFLVFISGYLLD